MPISRRLLALTVSCASTALFSVCAWSQNVPAGWTIIKAGFDLYPPGEAPPKSAGNCQMAVPPSWTRSGLDPHTMRAEAEHAFATVSASKPGLTFAGEVQSAKYLQKTSPIQGKTVLEDSDRRFWTQFGKTHWNVIAPGNPVCNLDLEFLEPSTAETAKKIVMSLSPAK